MVTRIPIEIPWPAGPVNVWVVRDDPVTLVDTGANLAHNVTALERGLAELGLTVEDVGRVVFTHHHCEHFALASLIRERSGAEVCALEAVVPWVADHLTSQAQEYAFEDALMRRHGVPEETIVRRRAAEPARDTWDASVVVDRVLRPGDRLEFASRSWTVHFAPGHSPYDTLLHDETGGEVFVGDHLLDHISSNALIASVDLAAVEDRPRALSAYRESLRHTRELQARVLYPGHGEVITGHRALIDHRLERIERRKERIAAAIGPEGRTAHDIAHDLWDERADTQAYLTLSEVLGHVDLLVEEGRVIEAGDGPVIALHTA